MFAKISVKEIKHFALHSNFWNDLLKVLDNNGSSECYVTVEARFPMSNCHTARLLVASNVTHPLHLIVIL